MSRALAAAAAAVSAIGVCEKCWLSKCGITGLLGFG